jgi:coniferyl-aldehyde dehydrogenase
MTEQTTPSTVWTAESMAAMLARQREAFLAELPVTSDTRIDRIDRAIHLLADNDGKIADALSTDYGCRPRDLSRFTEAAASMAALKYARKHVRDWMKPERRSLDFPIGLLGGRAWVEYVPKGVMGIISPWNFPVFLAFLPLAGALSAGNRAMIKPSEHTPATAELLAELIGTTFDETEVAVCTGGPEVGRAFSELPLDHLLFTGGTEIGRLVMGAAAKNLVPVTLELGGKSPVVVGRSADLERAALRVALGKLLNAGQVCIAPDYVFVPSDTMHDFVAAVERHMRSMYPSLKDNPEYTSVINESHYARLKTAVEEARRSGVEVREVNPAGEDLTDDSLHKLTPTIVIEPGDDLQLMQEEIFGPVLPVKGYREIDEVIAYVNQRQRPLCLYYFGDDAEERFRVLSRTTSGGVTVNDVLIHALIDALPFGGVGASGQGVYRGIDGFRAFSHPRAVFKAPRANMWKLLGLVPPYGKTLQKTLAKELKT